MIREPLQSATCIFRVLSPNHNRMSDSQNPPPPTSTPVMNTIATAEAEKIAFAAGTNAITAAAEAAAASEVARASDTASLLAKVDEKLKEHHEENKKEMRTMLDDVLGKVFGKEANAYVAPNRVLLLCRDVSYMKKSIEELVEAFKSLEAKYASKLTEKIVYSLIGMIVLGFMGSVVTFFLRQ